MFVKFSFLGPILFGKGTMDEIEFWTVSSTLPASCILTDHGSICQVQFQPEKDKNKNKNGLLSCGSINELSRVW